MSALLPSEFKGLRGVRGIPAAKVGGPTEPKPVSRMRLPPNLEDVLAPIEDSVLRAHGVALLIRTLPRGAKDRLHIEVTFGDGRYLDADGRLMPEFTAPPAIHKALAAILTPYPEITLDANAARDRLVLLVHGKVATGFDDFQVHYADEWIFTIDVAHLWIEANDYMAELGITPDMMASAVSDIDMARRIASELGFLGEAYSKEYNGRLHIIVRGRPGPRAELTASKYSAANKKMIMFAVGNRARFLANLKSASVVGFAFLAGDEAIRAIAGEQGYEQAIVWFGTGVAKILTSVVVADIIVALIFGTEAVVFVSFVAAAIIGFGIGVALNRIDEELGVTASLKERVANEPDGADLEHAGWPRL